MPPRVARHEINPHQGSLFVPSFEGVVPAMSEGQAFTSEPGPHIDLEIRSEKLLHIMTLLGKMSSNHGFDKAQFKNQTSQDLYDNMGVDGVGQYNTFIAEARTKRPEKLRQLFSEATGYEPQDPKSDGYNSHLVGNVAFKAFKEKYEGPQGQVKRVELRKKLNEQRKTFGWKPISTSRRNKK